MIDVIGIDAPCMDLLVNMDRLPQRNDSIRFRQMSWQGGGKAATALIALARLGVSCGIVANVGDDLYGDVIEWDFKRHHVDVSHLHHILGTYTSLSLVLSDRETMGRSVVWQGGGAPLVSRLDEAYLRQAKYLHVPGVHGIFEQAMDVVRRAGGKVVIDADRYDPEIVEKLSKIDVFIGSEFFFERLAEGNDVEACCRMIRERGPQTVVFTFGERGCAGIGEDGRFFKTPAFRVEVTDTTGAGDVFHGGFIDGLLKGWEAKRCAEWASAVSAIKVTRLGGRAGIPDTEMVETFLHTGAIDTEALDARAQWYADALQNTMREKGTV